MAPFLCRVLSRTKKIFATDLLNQTSHFAHERVFFSKSTTSGHAPGNLYRRISPLGDPVVSMVPVLDRWAAEGKSVDPEKLRKIITELTGYKRFKHALEVSQWMSDKRFITLTRGDVAKRITLIFKVDGLEAAESYFNNVAEKQKGFEAHLSLLNCYVHHKSVEKAEAIMEKLRIMGYITSSIAYNTMMNLYYKLRNWKKLDDLMLEMQEKRITFDRFTYGIRVSAYAAASDVEGVDKIALMMETDPRIAMDHTAYPPIAQGYLKVGHLDKVLATLKKMEGLAIATKTRTSARDRNLSLDFLLKMYAEIGRKDDVYRLWTMYKKENEIFNKGYIRMMSSLAKLNDVEGIKKIFEEWESRGLSYDFRIPNILISHYCRNRQLEKAEALIAKGSLEGGEPFSTTWYYMAEGYICDNQISKAVEALKKAVFTCQPSHWPGKEALTICMEYLESRGDAEKEEEFIRLLKTENIFSGVDHDKLLKLVKRGESQSSCHGQL